MTYTDQDTKRLLQTKDHMNVRKLTWFKLARPHSRFARPQSMAKTAPKYALPAYLTYMYKPMHILTHLLTQQAEMTVSQPIYLTIEIVFKVLNFDALYSKKGISKTVEEGAPEPLLLLVWVEACLHPFLWVI